MGSERFRKQACCSSALEHLADDLVFGHACGDGIQCRAALAAFAVEHVAVMRHCLF